jgi:uncharacterized protein YukE
MNEQPEALRLADMIERYNAGVHSQAIVEDYSRAADELRRLHEADEAFGKRQEWWNDRMFEMETALRQAVEALEAIAVDAKTTSNAYETARQAIAAAKQALGEAMSIDAMKLALEALESLHKRGVWGDFYGVADTLRAALEQPEQEPVAWRWKAMVNGDFVSNWVLTHSEPPPYALESQPLYTHPPRREWQELTTDEMKAVADRYQLKVLNVPVAFRAIEAALKEKNQ